MVDQFQPGPAERTEYATAEASSYRLRANKHSAEFVHYGRVGRLFQHLVREVERRVGSRLP